MGSILPLLSSFAIVLSGALLFTNGIEWLGHKLQLGEGAVGSLLAAVATALPESVIPIVALATGADRADDVTTGAILGAPFLLATLAMALAGVAAVLYRNRRPQGMRVNTHAPTIARDLGFFVACLSVALATGLVGAPFTLRLGVAGLLLLAYATYVRLTLAQSGDIESQESMKPLVFDITRGDPPGMGTVVVQLSVALGAIVGGAHLFVDEVVGVAGAVGVEPLVLSLVLAPLATELPEKLNSFFWIREGKDSLALGNITGAMVFQSTVPVTFGLAFTPWQLDEYSILAGALALAGGILAIATLQVRRCFSGRAIGAWAVLYAVFVAYVIAAA